MLVGEEEMRNTFLKVISDEYMRRIICSTIVEAKSIEEIKQESGIPISTCYRRVHDLVNLRLLKVESTIITDMGKKFERYRSTISGATVSLLSGELTVDVEVNPKVMDDNLYKMWKSMKKEKSEAISILV